MCGNGALLLNLAKLKPLKKREAQVALKTFSAQNISDKDG